MCPGMHSFARPGCRRAQDLGYTRVYVSYFVCVCNAWSTLLHGVSALAWLRPAPPGCQGARDSVDPRVCV
jgi:hypothetical protein